MLEGICHYGKREACSGNGDSEYEEREFIIFNHVIPACLIEKAALHEDMGVENPGEEYSRWKNSKCQAPGVLKLLPGHKSSG